jgi:hypothetical protein
MVIERVKRIISKAKFPRVVKKRQLRKVLPKSKRIKLKMPDKEIQPVLEDPNRFFKSKFEEDKRNFFLK